MASKFGYFTDAALTLPLTGGLLAVQKADVAVVDPVVFTLYFGSLGSLGDGAVDLQLRRDSAPGTDQVNFKVGVVANAAHVNSEIKLAVTVLPADWATVIGGDPIAVGVQVLSGAANAIKLFVQVDDATHAVGTLTELSVLTDPLLEESYSV